LVNRQFEDKSKLLALAGYTMENWQQLKADLLEFAMKYSYIITNTHEYGVFIQISGEMVGVNNKILSINTIWLKEIESNFFRFITLFPLKTD